MSRLQGGGLENAEPQQELLRKRPALGKAHCCPRSNLEGVLEAWRDVSRSLAGALEWGV